MKPLFVTLFGSATVIYFVLSATSTGTTAAVLWFIGGVLMLIATLIELAQG